MKKSDGLMSRPVFCTNKWYYIRGNFAFQNSFVFGHTKRMKIGQNVIKPILKMQNINFRSWPTTI